MKISSSFSLFRASCRIRTNDPEITNHVLWPTELKRRGWVSLLYRAATTNYPVSYTHLTLPTILRV